MSHKLVQNDVYSENKLGKNDFCPFCCDHFFVCRFERNECKKCLGLISSLRQLLLCFSFHVNCLVNKNNSVKLTLLLPHWAVNEILEFCGQTELTDF